MIVLVPVACVIVVIVLLAAFKPDANDYMYQVDKSLIRIDEAALRNCPTKYEQVRYHLNSIHRIIHED